MIPNNIVVYTPKPEFDMFQIIAYRCFLFQDRCLGPERARQALRSSTREMKNDQTGVVVAKYTRKGSKEAKRKKLGPIRSSPSLFRSAKVQTKHIFGGHSPRP